MLGRLCCCKLIKMQGKKGKKELLEWVRDIRAPSGAFVLVLAGDRDHMRLLNFCVIHVLLAGVHIVHTFVALSRETQGFRMSSYGLRVEVARPAELGWLSTIK